MEQQDAKDLEQFGYRQQLERSLGAFSSFAIAFSLISINTGIFANFGHGYRHVGPAVLWSWLVVLGGQLLVALVMARLAVRIPLAGYGYQWTARLVNPHFGFMAGWLLLLQFLTGFPAVCSALAGTLGGVLFPEGVDLKVLSWGSAAVILVVTLIHLFGLRLAAWINNAGVYAEMAGVAVLTIALFWLLDWSRKIDLGSLLTPQSGLLGGTVGLSSLSLSLLMGAWCLTGFEAAADLAEETHQPRRTIPRAMLLSLLGSGLAGFLLLLGVVLTIKDVTATQQADNPLLTVLLGTFSSGQMTLIMAVVAISILACAIASMAAASRLLFSLARDGMLPGSGWLGQIDEGHRTPRHALLLVWLLSTVVVLVFRQTDLISSISAVAGYLGYACIMVAALWQARTAGPRRGRERILPTLALLWTLGLSAALVLPETEIPGWTDRHIPAKATSIAILLGLLIYLFWLRRRLLRGEAGPPLVAAEVKPSGP
ncbi:MAG: APC family permease [Blastocatellia bacterium]